MMASFAGHFPVVNLLVDVGQASIMIRNRSEQTCMSLAATQSHAEIVRFLLNRGFPSDHLDAFGWTPLMLAAHANQGNVIQVLLQAGANPELRNGEGRNALQVAQECDAAWAIQLLAPVTMHSGPQREPYDPFDPASSSSESDKANAQHHPERTLRPLSLLETKNLADFIQHGSQLEYSTPLPNYEAATPCSATNSEYGSVIVPLTVLHSRTPSDEANPSEDATGMPLTYEQTLQYIPVPETTRRVGLRHRNPSTRSNGNGTIRRQSSWRHHISLPSEVANALPQDGTGPGIDVPTCSIRTPPNKYWKFFSQVVTFWAPSIVLRKVLKLQSNSIQQAWREKIALCFCIFLISVCVGFLVFGFTSIACVIRRPLFRDTIAREFGERPVRDSRVFTIVRGQIYNLGAIHKFGYHRIAVAKNPDLDANTLEKIDQGITEYFGKDVTAMFPLPPSKVGCPVAPDVDSCATLVAPATCHRTAEAHKLLDRFYEGEVSWSWANITDTKINRLFVYSHRVFSLTQYLSPNYKDKFLAKPGMNVTDEELLELVGTDATLAFEKSKKLRALLPCLEDHFRVGMIDGYSAECLTSNAIMMVVAVVLFGLVAIKFSCAIAFDWVYSHRLGRIKGEHSKSWVICLVTCFSEHRAGIKVTLDSLAATTYNNNQKLLFIVADGDVTGAGQELSTPNIIKSMISIPTGMPPEPEPYSYVSIGYGAMRHNMAQVYSGYYLYEGQNIPCVLINKVGNPTERGRPNAGNRGKRDSQLILMQWLNKLAFNDRMTPLEFDLSDKLTRLTGKFPTIYDLVLMVDADTRVDTESIGTMVSAFEKDPTIMGLTGETKIANKRDSWVTAIQVFEYYISHHLGKAFESIFGGVTCLPGCFCMYRIRAPKDSPDGGKGLYFVPILASPRIVERYGQNEVVTLHEKNLLLLGEDRYLTTLMLQNFPKRKMIYVPRAFCKTEVPKHFTVLLSQRRRWINSTIHNLMELVLIRDLCGTFCFSMQFVVALVRALKCLSLSLYF
jgi:chitin synthase